MRNDGRIWTLAALVATAGLVGFTSGSRGIVRRGNFRSDPAVYTYTCQCWFGDKRRNILAQSWLKGGALFDLNEPKIDERLERGEFDEFLLPIAYEEFEQRFQEYPWTEHQFQQLSRETRSLLTLRRILADRNLVVTSDVMSPLAWSSQWTTQKDLSKTRSVKFFFLFDEAMRQKTDVLAVFLKGTTQNLERLLRQEISP